MESVGQLAAGIAHEINTPMQFVGDNTYFLQDAFKTMIECNNKIDETISSILPKENYPELYSIINEIILDYDIEYLTNEIPIAIERTQNGIERVSKIVLAMKNFAHPSGKQKALSNINQGIDVTVTISRNEWKYSTELEIDLNESMPLVKCSLDEINQVVLNMIINSTHGIQERIAIEPTLQGKIIIKTYYDDKFAYISISDNGIGISKENQARIFDPFFTTKEVGKGTGQGLAIAHDIITNKHNGEIIVDSEVNKGTKFILKIPVE